MVAAAELAAKMALQAKLRGDGGDTKEEKDKQEQVDILQMQANQEAFAAEQDDDDADIIF